MVLTKKLLQVLLLAFSHSKYHGLFFPKQKNFKFTRYIYNKYKNILH